MTRPNTLLWIWYTLGGRLGSPYREWVLHDTTCRTRWLRQVVRAVVRAPGGLPRWQRGDRI